jgi:class 3 adenylate cyclase
MFADISGFTSWSSTRNPEAVLRLLECIYRAFDLIAKAQRVYKVCLIVMCLWAADVDLSRLAPLTSILLEQFSG